MTKHKKKKDVKKIENIDTSVSETIDSNDGKTQQMYLDLVLKQNAALENAIRSLTSELEDATTGILMRGYLHKWRDRMISFASSWGLRYFVLQGNILSYYGDEHDRHPRKTIELVDCIVLDEGKTKNQKHHIFSVVLKGAVDASRGPQSGALIRMSSDNEAEAMQWIQMLGKACGVKHTVDSLQDSPFNFGHGLDESSIPKPLLARVKSSGKLLHVSKRSTAVYLSTSRIIYGMQY